MLRAPNARFHRRDASDSAIAEPIQTLNQYKSIVDTFVQLFGICAFGLIRLLGSNSQEPLSVRGVDNQIKIGWQLPLKCECGSQGMLNKKSSR